MKRTLLLLALLTGCGLMPSAYCEEVFRATCTRAFDCSTGAEHDALVTRFGDPVSCARQQSQTASCSTQTEASLCSRTWHANEALVCVQEIQSASCDRILGVYRPTCTLPCH